MKFNELRKTLEDGMVVAIMARVWENEHWTWEEWHSGISSKDVRTFNFPNEIDSREVSSIRWNHINKTLVIKLKAIEDSNK